MGRTDAWALQLPEPPPIAPEAGDAQSLAGAQILEMLSRRSAPQPRFEPVADSSAAGATPAAAESALASCPSCKANLSGVEQKMERCLSCGTSFAASAGSIKVGI